MHKKEVRELLATVPISSLHVYKRYFHGFDDGGKRVYTLEIDSPAHSI